MRRRNAGLQRSLWLGPLILAAGLPGAAGADPLAITRWSADGGGTGYIQVGSFTVGATAGQPDAGRLENGTFVLWGGFWAPASGAPVSVGDGDDLPSEPVIPLMARIHPLKPNPFTDRTTIAFELPEAREVEIQVFDVGGALQRSLRGGSMPAGRHALEWNAADASGRRVRAGIYFVRVRLGDLSRSQKVIVLK